MFQKRNQFLRLKCAGSALKCSETQVREMCYVDWGNFLLTISLASSVECIVSHSIINFLVKREMNKEKQKFFFDTMKSETFWIQILRSASNNLTSCDEG